VILISGVMGATPLLCSPDGGVHASPSAPRHSADGEPKVCGGGRVHRLTVNVAVDLLRVVLLAGPAIRALAHGASRVTLLCGPRGRQAAALLPGVDEVVCWAAPWIEPEP
jgi:hypothetical protein